MLVVISELRPDCQEVEEVATAIRRAVAVAAVAFRHVDLEAARRRRRVRRLEDVGEGGDRVFGQVEVLRIGRRAPDVVRDFRF